jgi:hypothetical protein
MDVLEHHKRASFGMCGCRNYLIISISKIRKPERRSGYTESE